MRSRLRSLARFLLDLTEASLTGLFLIQALRFLIGTLYAHIASASLYPALDPTRIDPLMLGLITPSEVNQEVTLLLGLLVLPLVTVVIGRFRMVIPLAVFTVAVGRYVMAADFDLPVTLGASLVVGGGLAYIALLVRHRAGILPYMFLVALGIDQLFRAWGNTLDPSWDAAYAPMQWVLSLVVSAIAVLVFIVHRRQAHTLGTVSPDRGMMPFWGGVGFGALLFLQLSFLAMPNAIGGRTGMDYTLLVPMVVFATILPLVPWLQDRARWFIGSFDRGVRGWAWMLLVMLLLVLGLRTREILAGGSLVAAQFMVSMIWWWITRPQAAKERNFTGAWVVVGVGIFALLLLASIFTYEYAFVRDFAPEYDFLNPVIPPLLRGLRGMGLAVLLLAVFLAVMPMIQTRHRIAWKGAGSGSWGISFTVIGAAIGISALASSFAQPPVVQGVNNPESIRVGTYNIHAGFNEFYHYDLEALALNIQYSGANVVLLQEIEVGRMTSFGVDQPLWLARRLGMDMRFYPTNEGLHGLAILSNIEIVYDDGVLLDSIGQQTGLQRVQVRPDAGIITVYNTWLNPLLDTGSGEDIENLERDQRKQLSQIFGVISAQHQPDGRLGRMVFGGTFNNIPDSDLIRQMSENGFADYFEEAHVELSATLRRADAMARVDYLWTTTLGSFRVLNATVIDPVSAGVLTSHPSDHRMAVILVQLR